MSSAMLAALQASALQLAILVEATFQTETIYIWSGTGSIAWNGQTWIGLGSLLSISTIEQGVQMQGKGISIGCSGIDQSLLADVLQEMALGQPVTVYIALFASGSIIVDPLSAWQGRMDQPTLDMDGTTVSISIACETRLIDMDVSVERRYTQDDQQMDNPGDLFFSFVNGIQECTIQFGTTAQSSSNL
jgi:hypothetical protein